MFFLQKIRRLTTTGCKENYPAIRPARTGFCLLATVFYTGLLQYPGTSLADYGIQLGAFDNKTNAEQLARELIEKEFPARLFPPTDSTSKLTRIIVGPFFHKSAARDVQQQLASNGWHGFQRDYPVTTNEPLVVAADSGHGADDDEEILIIDEADSTDDVSPEGDDDTILLMDDDDTLLLLDEDEPEMATDSQDSPSWTDYTRYENGRFSIGLDKARLEYGNLYQSKSSVNTTNYGHLALSAEWNPDSAWETRFGGRIDWYDQTGSPSVDEVDFDYGDSFVRYRGENYRVTAGTQKVIWGRIDEVPPTDRLSRADISRGILDPLSERRRAMPVLRFEGFHEGYKLDAVFLPLFRKAAQADKDNIWYPVNQTNGTILGVESNALMKTFVQQGRISDSAPDGDGGFGLRMSNTGQQFDYAVTVQHARQSTPYFELDPSVRRAFLNGATPAGAIAAGKGATFKARYPRSWVAGGDFGFEALSATWRFEGAWISDTPVTRKDLRYDTVSSISWAAGAQFYPGDSNVRVNLQITGVNLIDAPAVLDRTDIYNFNGSIFNEFGNNRWQATTRFFIGLDQKDIYINPEISFIGWEPHELYAGLHYFNGEEDTIGGYWENNSLLTVGWRSQF